MPYIAKINGVEIRNKNRVALEIIRQFINKNSDKTIEDFKGLFNAKGFGPTYVVIDEDEKKDFILKKGEEEFKKRYFSNEKDIVFHNDKPIYITTQWGSDKEGFGRYFDAFLSFAKNDLGFVVEEIESNTYPNTTFKAEQGYEMKQLKTKNIILYGAPGVGKTHNTNKLIHLIEESESEKDIFEAIQKPNENYTLKEFDDDLKSRVKFVTFHQSFGYEDFIEGFRPNEDGDIKIEDGVFKRLVQEAEKNLVKSSIDNMLLFSDALDLLLKDKIENEDVVKVDLKRDNSYFTIYDYNDRTIFFEKQNGNKAHSLSIKTLEKMYYDEVNEIIKGGLAPYYNPILEILLDLKRKKSSQKIERKNYYLIIDEINRGNISKIFGELITLIEEDKRDNYEVTLPYSKDTFKIPSNLFIIGTMNSTDKSIALIDIALRRRFTFLKMKPNASLVQHSKAKEVFEKLNEQITKDLGEDYQIGHSYLMKISNDDELEFTFEYKIKPLLEEYYFGNKNGYEEIIKIIEP